MTKIPFNIMYRPQIESGKFKVVTADGRPVTIQRWDMKGNYPILACTMVKQCNWEGDESWDEERPFAYDKDGHAAGTAPADKLELFLISEDPELTEFEENFLMIIKDCNDSGLRKKYQEYFKEASTTLLNIARKQLMLDCEDKYKEGRAAGIELGKIEALKNIPRWYKTDEEAFTIAGDMLFYKGYKIDISELEKLPKED